MSFPRRPFARLALIAVLAVGAAIPAHAGDPLASATGRDGSLGASGEAALTPHGAVASRWSGPTIPGIDISHWQGTIDWTK
ncbi:MAG: hypothetical protein ACXWYI_07530, partial [Actinomycetota bacterium]